MNQELESRAEREPETWSAAEREPLGEIEQRLKRIRPRAAVVEVAAIEQAAFANSAEPASRTAASVANCRRTGPRRRSFRFASALAGSWICGAVAGALGMFLLVEHSLPDSSVLDSPAQHAATSPETEWEPAPAAERELAEGPAIPEIQGGPSIEAARPRVSTPHQETIVARIASPFGGSNFGGWLAGPPLRVGMHLTRYAGDAGEPPPHAAGPTEPEADERQDREATTDAKTDAKSGFVPRTESTRERLLEELLDVTSGAVVF